MFVFIQNPMTEERRKVQELETNYGQVWDSRVDEHVQDSVVEDETKERKEV